MDFEFDRDEELDLLRTKGEDNHCIDPLLESTRTSLVGSIGLPLTNRTFLLRIDKIRRSFSFSCSV